MEKKIIWHANCPGFEEEKQLRTWIMLWKIKTWVKTEIPWDWLLLKAAICLYVGGLQSLLPVIKLLQSGGRFFVDAAVLIHQAKVMPQSALAHRSVLPSCTGAREWGVPSSVISPSLDHYCWEQERAAEIIDVMHCHLVCLFSHYHKPKPGRYELGTKLSLHVILIELQEGTA